LLGLISDKYLKKQKKINKIMGNEQSNTIPIERRYKVFRISRIEKNSG
jgi:hypothetical protein